MAKSVVAVSGAPAADLPFQENLRALGITPLLKTALTSPDTQLTSPEHLPALAGAVRCPRFLSWMLSLRSHETGNWQLATGTY